MEDNFDYGAVPYNFAHCFNDRCPKGEKCLRHLVAVHSTDLHSIISVVNPKCVPEEGNTCPFYKPVRKIRVAWGVTHLLDTVPHREEYVARAFRSCHVLSLLS